MIKILFNYGLPGSGKTLVSRREEELLRGLGLTPHFMHDKQFLDIAVWKDVSRFLQDPAHRTPEGGVIGEHSLVFNPDVGIGRFRIDFFDGDGLTQCHIEYFNKLEEFLRTAGPKDIAVAEITPGNDDYSFGEGKQPVIHSPAWNREQITRRGLLDVALVQEIIADDAVRFKRNDERLTYNIPYDVMDREFRNNGGTFSPLDRFALGNRYTNISNNGDDESALFRLVDQRFSQFVEQRLLAEGQIVARERGR